jgi:hypothetical protein
MKLIIHRSQDFRRKRVLLSLLLKSGRDHMPTKDVKSLSLLKSRCEIPPLFMEIRCPPNILVDSVECFMDLDLAEQP